MFLSIRRNCLLTYMNKLTKLQMAFSCNNSIIVATAAACDISSAASYEVVNSSKLTF